MACDGTGQCTKTPLDDNTCGIIDCDSLDTKCRDYHDLTANRCDSLGSCKQANSTATCTSYTDICNDAGVVMDRGVQDMQSAMDVAAIDAGATPDMEAGAAPDLAAGKEAGTTPPPPDTTDDGCTVSPTVSKERSAPAGGTYLLLGLLLLAGLTRRRKSL